MTVAQATAAELRGLGVDHFFLMSGRDNALWVAFQAVGIRQVLTRSEQAAVCMADGYARITGRPTFTYGANGPGASNVAGALAEPFWSSSPVIALCSMMRRTERFKSEYQDLEQLPLFQSVTKWGVEVPVAGQVPRFIREAARRSVTGRPGPVYLGVPGDVIDEEVPGYRSPAPNEAAIEMPVLRPSPTAADVDTVVAALRGAARPMIVAGNGVHQSAGYEPLRLLAERLGVPVVTSLGGKGTIAENHDLAFGAVGRYSRNYANEALSRADVILAVGTALCGLVTDGYKLIKPGAALYHVSMDADVLGSHFPTRLGMLADARSFLSMALESCDRSNDHRAANGQNGHHGNGHNGNGNGRIGNGHIGNVHNGNVHNGNGHHGNGHESRYHATSPWVAELTERRDAWRGARADLGLRDGSDGRPMRPEAIMPVLDELMADDAIVVADTGYASAWAGALLELRSAGRNFLRADGSLGWAFPGALGAQMAAPEKQVICVIGDGGFGYNVTEIETMVRLNLPVTVVILNNQTLAFELHVQDLLLRHPVPEVDDFLDVDYGGVARAFGANGIRVTNAADFRSALSSALERRGPTVIDAVIDRNAIPPATRYDAVRTREL